MKTPQDPEAAETVQTKDIPAVAPAATCSAFEIFELRYMAMAALPKRELIRLLTQAGWPPKVSRDRERHLMATRLARYADRVTITIEWDDRMQNS